MPTLIQSAQRALAIIEYLNAHNGANTRDICKAFDLSRGTGYRLLETLRRGGYITKEEGSQSYWLAGRVLALSSGYAGELWVERYARPLIVELGRELQWPIRLTTRQGDSILVRISTDYLSHLTFVKKPSGLQVGLFATASGAIFQAFDESDEMEGLKANALKKDGSRVLSDEEKAHIRSSGYLLRDLSDTAILAVPVQTQDGLLACLTLEYFRRTITPSKAIDQFVPKLQAAATSISERVAEVDLSLVLESG